MKEKYKIILLQKENKMISKIKDVDREILSKLDDRELLKVCSIDKYTWNTVCDDAFLKRRLLAKYPKIESNKRESESWKHFFLRAVHVIAKMKEKYGYDYTFGDFFRQNKLLNKYYNKYDKNEILFKSSKGGELALVIWILKNGVDVHSDYEKALKLASQFGHLEVVKYLVENGADLHTDYEYALKVASQNGHLETVKYLVEKGADIHAQGDSPLIYASLSGHLEIVKYLVENGANIHIDGDEPLLKASMNGYLEIVKYLVEKGAEKNAINIALRWANRYGNIEVVNYLKNL